MCMNKNAIKKFAIEARKKLIASVSDKAGMLGITPEACSEPINKGVDFEVYKTVAGTEVTLNKNQCIQRRKLAKQIAARGFEAVVEEVAYTWFNRICAIRFMEVNDYLPTRVRVLSSEKEGKNEPDIVTQAPDVDLDFSDKEREYIFDCKMNNKLDELFKMLFVKQCNKLSEILPELFEATEDYTEMLLNISYTNKDDIINMLVNPDTGIPEADFNVSIIGEDGEPTGQVEIIGWLYQYYNTEPKADIFARASGTKMKKEDIPAATQLFTPDWIVRYMVENSVGRIWVEGHPNDSLKNSWDYYVDEAEQEQQVVAKLEDIKATYKGLTPDKIKVIDPCMGSGHILVYAFDVLMQIYENYGYAQRDATRSILQNNIFGLDIDERAYQLAYFAVMMKARQYNRRILTEGIEPNLCFIKSSKPIQESALEKMGEYKKITQKLIDEFRDVAEYGSIMNVSLSEADLQRISEQLEAVKDNEDIGNLIDIMDCNELISTLTPLLKQAKLLIQKYAVVVTNPPYLSGSAVGAKLSDYLKKHYPDSKTDLFACFLEKGSLMTIPNGFNCMVTMQSWMFLSSFEKMRQNLLNRYTINNLMHMENMVMGIAFGTAVTTIRNCRIAGFKGTYNHIKMKDIKNDKPICFPIPGNRFAQISTENYGLIPGAPIAYWAGKQIFEAFSKGHPLSDFALARNGMKTGDNGQFLRLWWEVDNHKTNTQIKNYSEAERCKEKWFPYNKGGEYRKWYGNNDYVINWENCGYKIFSCAKTDKRNVQDYPAELKFTPSLSWSLVTSGKPAFRYKEHNLSDIAGMSLFSNRENIVRYLGLLNSDVALEVLRLITPTINFQAGDIARIPIMDEVNNNEEIIPLVEKNIEISKKDWDSFEQSWDFKKHPLVPSQRGWSEQLNSQFAQTRSEAFSKLSWHYQTWEQDCEYRFVNLKENEKQLNKIFIDIYGLQDELTADVEDKNVSVRRAEIQRDIKSLLSYAVGCMFGRYSLDSESIAFAGGEWDESKYGTFIPDKDNCIPITDEEYFEDDIVGRFCEWLKKVYGFETLEENLDFIANALGNKGKTSRETIREYFVNDFMTDHMRIYQKRPIYWLFDSGKANGFKALVYMHRYNSDTVAKVRVDYLHNVQKSIEQAKTSAEYLRDNGSGAEKAKATKLITKYTKQLAEIHLYDEAMAHIANQRIDIDLDDGVKVNYEKFQGVEVAQEGKKALKIDLLAKIK